MHLVRLVTRLLAFMLDLRLVLTLKMMTLEDSRLLTLVTLYSSAGLLGISRDRITGSATLVYIKLAYCAGQSDLLLS